MQQKSCSNMSLKIKSVVIFLKLTTYLLLSETFVICIYIANGMFNILCYLFVHSRCKKRTINCLT